MIERIRSTIFVVLDLFQPVVAFPKDEIVFILLNLKLILKIQHLIFKMSLNKGKKAISWENMTKYHLQKNVIS